MSLEKNGKAMWAAGRVAIMTAAALIFIMLLFSMAKITLGVFTGSGGTYSVNISSLGTAGTNGTGSSYVVRLTQGMIAANGSGGAYNVTIGWLRIGYSLSESLKWSAPSASIVPSYSPTTLSQFNITWRGSTVSTAFLESNYSGSPANYTMSHAGSGNYTFNATIPAGTYYWRSYANDTADNWNASGPIGFTVDKAAAQTITVYLNSATPNQNSTIIYGVQTNVTATTSASQSLKIYRNGTQVASTTGTSLTYLETLASSYYNFTAVAETTQNYTASSTAYFQTINKADNKLHVYLNNNLDQNNTITYGAQSNATATADFGVTTTLDFNGSPTNTYQHIATLAAASYNYTAYSPGNQNYTFNSTNYFLTLGKAATTTRLFLNGTEANARYKVGEQANLTAVVNVAGKTLYLYANISGWSLQNGAGSVTGYATMSSGFYNVTAYFPGDQNYTPSSQTYFATVPSLEPSISPQSVRREQDYKFAITSSMTVQESSCADVNATINGVPSTALVDESRTQTFGTVGPSVQKTGVWHVLISDVGTYRMNVTWNSSDCTASTTSDSYATVTPYVQPALFNAIFSSQTEYRSGETITQAVLLTYSNGTYVPGASCSLDIYNTTFADKVVTNASMAELPSTGLYKYQNSTITAEGVYTGWVNCTTVDGSAYTSRSFHIAPWANAVDLTNIDTKVTQLQNTVGSGNGAVTIWNITQQTNLTTQEINRTIAEMNKTLHQLNDSIRATVVPKIDLALGNLTEIRALAIEINNTLWHVDLAHLGNYSLSTLTDEIRLNRDQLTSLKAKMDTEAEFSKESVFLVTDSVNSVNSALQQMEAGNIATARLSLDTAAKSMAKAAEAYALEPASATVVRTPPSDDDGNDKSIATATSGLTGSYQFFLEKSKLTQVVKTLAYIIVSAILGLSLFRRVKPPSKGRILAKKYAFDRILPYISPGGWREVGGSIGLALLGTSSKLRKGKRVKRARTKAKHVRAKPGVWEDDDQEGVGNSGE